MTSSPPPRRPRALPSGRWSRLASMGSLAGNVAGNMFAEGLKQALRGQRPRLSDLLLTPGNVQRVADQLSRLRGAAMKVGQLISMDSGDVLPPELAEILALLRADATPMPMSQLVKVLEANWGQGWEHHFRRFSFTPLAAASIGQVHRAESLQGEPLAVKVQYPGVRRSIDSDVDNVVTLLRMSGLLPRGLDLDPLLHEAKQQLHAEADYLGERAWLTRYGELLADVPDFVVPMAPGELSTENILVMGFVAGEPIESVLRMASPERNRVARLLFELLFRELFEFRLIQTDPNFANYLYDHATHRLVLLDFGAVRAYSSTMVDAYRRLLRGAATADRNLVNEAAGELGYFQRDIQERHREQVLDMFLLACEPLRHAGPYDFGGSDLPARMRRAGMALGMEKDFWHTPPADTIFLHRKLGGIYLLAARLRVALDVRQLVAPYLGLV